MSTYEKGVKWIGFDLDGTLALYNGVPSSASHIGAPIRPMVDLARRFIADGHRVKVFTARVAEREHLEALDAIQAWCVEHLGARLEVTCVKDFDMWVVFDDRAVGVVLNAGRTVDDILITLATHIRDPRVVMDCRIRGQLVRPLFEELVSAERMIIT